jgi:hypothetical protein
VAISAHVTKLQTLIEPNKEREEEEEEESVHIC